jgi:hypothetical protein
MGLFENAVNWGASNVFGSSDIGPAETIWLAPASDWTVKRMVSAVVIRDHLQGSNEVRGDGVNLEKPAGRSVRESIVIEFQAGEQLQRIVDSQKPDQVKVDDVIWSAVRRLGNDSGMQAYLFVRSTDVAVFRRG